MRRVVDIAAAGDWPNPANVEQVTLSYDDRVRRRLRIVSDSGQALMLDLPSVVRLEDGAGLHLENGEWIKVVAADEDVVEATCHTPEALARLAWHIGNRHVPAQILPSAVRFRDDPVIVAMVEGLGAHVRQLRAPFQPEAGAYHRHGNGGHSHG